MVRFPEAELDQGLALRRVIVACQQQMARKLENFIAQVRFSRGHYARYLTMQYHLTRGVQRYFLTAAAHEEMASRKRLRAFLCEFASEEELHFTIAERDLAALGLEPGPEPFDVILWHSYFERVTAKQPFIRLGAACALENLSSGSVRQPLKQLLSADFLDRDNTRFIVLHQHETIPHGDQILEALDAAHLTSQQWADAELGARQGGLLFLRFIDWALLRSEDEQALFGVTYPEPEQFGRNDKRLDP